MPDRTFYLARKYPFPRHVNDDRPPMATLYYAGVRHDLYQDGRAAHTETRIAEDAHPFATQAEAETVRDEFHRVYGGTLFTVQQRD